MSWEESCVVLTKYYGISPIDIPEMTLYQFAYYIKKMDWLEGQTGKGGGISSSPDVIMGGQPGQVPSSSDIRALAKKINPNIVFPED